MKLFGFNIISDVELKRQLTKAKQDEAVACAQICFDRSLEFADLVHKQCSSLPKGAVGGRTLIEHDKLVHGNMTAEQACSGDYHRIVRRIEAHKYGKDLDDE